MKASFQAWFESYGDQLLEGYLRAREDGSDKTFTGWVTGEYDVYLEGTLRCPECQSIMEEAGLCDSCGEHIAVPAEEDYEVPYHGIYDNKGAAEKMIGKEVQ